ncbi:MAG: HEAT repeat domain-containing protein [Bacteroidota bacterium]
MNKDDIIALLPEYLDNALDDVMRKKVERHLKECASCSKALEELKTLFKAFEQEERCIPSDRVRTNFYEVLEREKHLASKVINFTPSVRKKWRGPLLKVAASIALLIGSFLAGKQFQKQKSGKEIAQLTDESIKITQTAMLSLMENQSASRRIQGVHFIDEITDPDEAIVRALANRMLHDDNTNVRLTAVEALGKFTTSEIVKNAFITALQTEKDPSIQISLIHTLVKIQEKKAIKPLQRLLQQEETQPFVKQQIESLLPHII